MIDVSLKDEDASSSMLSSIQSFSLAPGDRAGPTADEVFMRSDPQMVGLEGSEEIQFLPDN